MKELYKKLFEIQGMNLRFEKEASNPFFKSKYLALEDLQEKLNPILQEVGLLVYHNIDTNTVITSVVDPDGGERISSGFPIQEGIEPQKVGSAITYGKRYNLGALFNIITDEDDDANATQNKQARITKTLPDNEIPF